MVPVVLIGGAILIGGALLARRRKAESPGPLTEDPDQAATEAEAVAAAQTAAAEAAEAAKRGDTQAAGEAVDKAAEAAAAAAGTNAQTIVDMLAKQAEELLKQTAAKTGEPVPVTSPGQPPLPSEKSEPTVVVNGQTQTPTATFPTLPTSIPTTLEEAAASLPIPITLTPPGVLPPLAKEETSAEADPSGTIALARLLLDRETRPNWRDAEQAAVSTWQRRAGLKADGKFGPGSALKMGQEVGVLPLIRFWPLGFPTKQAALQKYRDDLHTLAANLDAKGRREHAAAIDVSAQREDARAFGNASAAPVTAGDRIAVLEQLAGKVA